MSILVVLRQDTRAGNINDTRPPRTDTLGRTGKVISEPATPSSKNLVKSVPLGAVLVPLRTPGRTLVRHPADIS